MDFKPFHNLYDAAAGSSRKEMLLLAVPVKRCCCWQFRKEMLLLAVPVKRCCCWQLNSRCVCLRWAKHGVRLLLQCIIKLQVLAAGG
jgi:hypothetical protein